MKNQIIKALFRAANTAIFFCVFYSFPDSRMQVAFTGALIMTAVYFDAEKWELK